MQPDSLGLRLNPADSAQDQHRAIDHPNGSHHLGAEIDVTGRVDQVDAVIAPVARCGGRGDGDPTFALLRQIVELGIPIIDAARTMNAAGVVENRLGRGRFAGIDVRKDPNDAHAIEIFLLVGSHRLLSKKRPTGFSGGPESSLFDSQFALG